MLDPDTPVGTRVRYRPFCVVGTPWERARTRSAPWMLPGNRQVVLVDGRTGAVSTDSKFMRLDEATS